MEKYFYSVYRLELNFPIKLILRKYTCLESANQMRLIIIKKRRTINKEKKNFYIKEFNIE